MLEITKKRFTNKEVCEIKKWFASININSEWANIYLFSVSNVKIVRHLVEIYNSKKCTTAAPAILTGLKNKIVINHDEFNRTPYMEEFFMKLNSKKYNFVQVVGLSGKLYTRNYGAVSGNYDYDVYPVVRAEERYNNTLCVMVNDMMPYKLHIYITSGSNKGNIDRKEYFYNRESMDRRYNQLYKPHLYGYNPTAWELGADGEYTRILGY